METPPQYGPRKKSNTGLIIGLVLGGIGICCIGGLALVFGGGMWLIGKAKGIVNCTIAITEIRKATDLYVLDHDGVLPKADTWQDDIKPYLAKVKLGKTNDEKELGPFQRLDPNGEWGCKLDDGNSTGFAFNDDLSGKKVSDIKDPYSTMLIFEVTNTGRNLHQKYSVRDKSESPKMFGERRGWLEMPVMGEARNLGGGNNGFNIHTTSD